MTTTDLPIRLCHHTISGAAVGEPARHGFLDRVVAAADAGAAQIGITGQDFAALLEAGAKPAELRAIADDHGIRVVEVEFLNGWWAEGTRLAADRALEQTLYEAADCFGATLLAVGASVPADQAPPVEVLAERFAEVCGRATEHGLTVGLEYMPFFVLSDAQAAWRMVEASEVTNAGLVLDAFHHLRPGGSPTLPEGLPSSAIVSVQLSDVPAGTGVSLLEEALEHRVWPGEGMLDVSGLLADLNQRGVRCALGVEVLSARVRALPVQQAAAEAVSATRRTVAAAGTP